MVQLFWICVGNALLVLESWLLLHSSAHGTVNSPRLTLGMRVGNILRIPYWETTLASGKAGAVGRERDGSPEAMSKRSLVALGCDEV